MSASPDKPRNEWVIAYLSLGGTPAQNIIAFYQDPELGVLIHGPRRYDIDDPEEMTAFQEAQAKAFGCDRYSQNRMRVLPVSFFVNAIAARAATVAKEEAARQLDAAISKEAAERLAAGPDPNLPPAEDEDESEATETEVPPYAEWPFDDLKTEADSRGLDLKGIKKKTDLIALLEADDLNDQPAE